MRGRHIKIMIADSQPLCLLGLKSIVESQDNMKLVATASSQSEIISGGIRSNCDVLIIDPKQTDHNGLDSIRLMKERGFEGKVMILMSDVSREVYQQAKKLKVGGILLKTASAEKLIKSINDVFRGKIFVDEEVEKALANSADSSDSDLLESAKIEQLSQREYEILRLVASGNNNKSIAGSLFISEKTVKNHLTQIFKKLEVLDRVQATLFAVKHNIK
jgi:DNA-binding NarL/FixJ family response regulator